MNRRSLLKTFIGVRRLAGRRNASPLRSFRLSILFFSLALHVFAGCVFLLDHRGLPDEWVPQFLGLLAGSAALGATVLVLRRRLVSSVLVGLQAFLLLAAAYPQGFAPLLTGVFSAILALEWVCWLEYPLALSLTLGVAFVALLTPHPVLAWGTQPSSPTWEQDIPLALLAAGLVGFCRYLRRLAEQNGDQRREIEDLNRSVVALLDANLDFQNYAIEVGLSSTIQERRRLSREIHDVVGYSLINLKMMLERALDLAGRDNADLEALLLQSRDEVQNGLIETRRVLHLFRNRDQHRPEGLTNIQQMVNSFSRATGLDVEVNWGNAPWSFGDDLNAVVYRLIQESMTNAFRHGRATKIQIRFWITDEKLLIVVHDNGRGADEVHPGIGLTGMTERLAPLGGRLVAAGGARGFSVRAEIPYGDKP